MNYYLDDVDVTADIEKQTKIPNLDGGVYPNARTKWYNLLTIINAYPELKKSFFGKGGLHTFKIIGDAGYEYRAKIILRATYSARNS